MRFMSLERLAARVRRDLEYLSYPAQEWTIPRYHKGARVLDVLIVGAGQSGLATAFGLQRERVKNFRIVDRSVRGLEGPWRRFARMKHLRTPKEITGIDLGIASLTPRAWYEAKFGRKGWERIEAFPQHVWQTYLDWCRDVLDLPVENEVEVTSIEPAGDLLRAELRRKGRSERVVARKIVLATGIEGSGRWRIPQSLIARVPASSYAHTTDAIDFRKLKGKRVGVLGAGASAFDNAAAALEAGAKSVDLCFRRAEIPRVNPLTWTNFAGMLAHFGELSDLERWRFMRYILEKPPMPPPQEAFWRCRRFENFVWHANCAWKSLRRNRKAVTVETQARTFTFDFIIFATGFETNLSARSELAPIASRIALWRDRFTPPPGEESEHIASHPYLGPAFQFLEREPGTAPWLRRLHTFTWGAMPSLGLGGAAIPGLKYGVPRLVNGVVRDLFREDATELYESLLAYSECELKSLEGEGAYIDRLASEALSGVRELFDDLARRAAAKSSKRAVIAARASRSKRSGSRSRRMHS
jgi:cation diffusion facilitator CzcD-associated flavoprotein CzcO